jgi:hypothetical protein
VASDKWVKIRTVENIFEMDTLRAALEKEGIDYLVKEHKDTAYDGLFILQKGYATFYAKEDDEALAKAVVRGMSLLPHAVLPED